ncbi:hypothetical protein WH47_04717 [Habropoda laboriosa]|uniref:Uncharacterized protein n=1 Tax=Habropoda laboriosa TaxID=597456 RepID=A0A0L7QXN1_9HYME|nr:hypothetical protein WH47_04717 [Habropoda laboriosa]
MTTDKFMEIYTSSGNLNKEEKKEADKEIEKIKENLRDRQKIGGTVAETVGEIGVGEKIRENVRIVKEILMTTDKFMEIYTSSGNLNKEEKKEADKEIEKIKEKLETLLRNNRMGVLVEWPMKIQTITGKDGGNPDGGKLVGLTWVEKVGVREGVRTRNEGSERINEGQGKGGKDLRSKKGAAVLINAGKTYEDGVKELKEKIGSFKGEREGIKIRGLENTATREEIGERIIEERALGREGSGTGGNSKTHHVTLVGKYGHCSSMCDWIKEKTQRNVGKAQTQVDEAIGEALDEIRKRPEM